VEARELTLIAGLEERADKIRGASEDDATTQLHSLDTESDGKMRFSGADRSREDHILGPRDPLAARELGDEGRTYRSVGRCEIERVESLGLREARLVGQRATRFVPGPEASMGARRPRFASRPSSRPAW
jgi:hypothetical protein